MTIKNTLALEYEAEKTRSLKQVTFAINENITASGDMFLTVVGYDGYALD